MAIVNFIPTIWSARLLENLRKTLVYGQTGVINRDYEGDIKNAGDSVKILSIGAVNTDNYSKDTDITFQVMSDAAQTLAIDQAKYFAFEVDDVDKAQSLPNIIDSAMAESAYALRDVADAYIAAQMVAGVAAGNKIGTDVAPIALVAGDPEAGETNVYEALVNMRTKLDRSNVPTEGRWVVVPPEVYALLLKDRRFVIWTPQGGAVVQNGKVGDMAGFNVLQSNNVPTDAGETKYRVLAGYQGATTYAEQINKVEAIRREARFADGVKGLHLYGAKVARPSGLSLMIATVS